MKLPIKCGKMYIKFDENKNPEYGFEVSGNRIEKFVPLCNKEIDSIVLPGIVEENKFTAPDFRDKEKYKVWNSIQRMQVEKYAQGEIKVCDGCLAGIKEGRIVVPFENSIMLDWGCFDDDANIELVLPDNLTLKQVYRAFDSAFCYEHENWTLIGDKQLVGTFSDIGKTFDQISICKYFPETMEHKVANFMINNEKSLDDFENEKEI